MLFLCDFCWNPYDPQRITLNTTSPEWTTCPRLGCCGRLIEMDELIAPSIIELNQKGYRTKFCCSSHWYEEELGIPEVYIVFEKGTKSKLSTIPPGFQWDEEEDDQDPLSDTIRIGFEQVKSHYPSLYHFTLRSNLDLYEWIKGLPSLLEE